MFGTCFFDGVMGLKMEQPPPSPEQLQRNEARKDFKELNNLCKFKDADAKKTPGIPAFETNLPLEKEINHLKKKIKGKLEKDKNYKNKFAEIFQDKKICSDLCQQTAETLLREADPQANELLKEASLPTDGDSEASTTDEPTHSKVQEDVDKLWQLSQSPTQFSPKNSNDTNPEAEAKYQELQKLENEIRPKLKEFEYKNEFSDFVQKIQDAPTCGGASRDKFTELAHDLLVEADVQKLNELSKESKLNFAPLLRKLVRPLRNLLVRSQVDKEKEVTKEVMQMSWRLKFLEKYRRKFEKYEKMKLKQHCCNLCRHMVRTLLQEDDERIPDEEATRRQVIIFAREHLKQSNDVQHWQQTLVDVTQDWVKQLCQGGGWVEN